MPKATLKLPVLNQTTLAGYIASEAERLTTSTGIGATFIVAVPRGRHRETELIYVPCVTWGALAETLLNGSRRGLPVVISGSLGSRQLSKELHVRVAALQFLNDAPT